METNGIAQPDLILVIKGGTIGDKALFCEKDFKTSDQHLRLGQLFTLQLFPMLTVDDRIACQHFIGTLPQAKGGEASTDGLPLGGGKIQQGTVNIP